jgi:hypothetical protein
MSASNLLRVNGKIDDSYLPNPYPFPASAGLGEVLQVNNSALTPFGAIPQDATDFNTIGCVKIETGTVGQGNNLALAIGEAGDNLQIKGATLLGSMLAGNGANTETLPLGTNGYVLTADSTAGVGVKWNPAGGAGVASITAGTNIDVVNTIPTAPVVSLKNPLTAELNLGAQSIRDSAGAVGTSGQVLTAGTGAQTLWGTNGVSSVTAGTNISITGTSSAPIVNLGTAGVLTSTLNTGTQNVQGTSTQFTLTNGGSQANVQANLGFTSAVQATPTTKANLFNTSVSVETLANKVQMTPTYLLKTVGATAFQIGTVGSAPINLVGAGGGADGISITQLPSVGTTLTTGITNVKYYPDYYLSNNDSITQAVPAPQVIHQRLTLNNLGLTNTSIWNDYGGLIAAGYSAFFRDSNNNLWLAEQGTGNIQICDNPPTTTLYNITMSGTLTGGATAVNVFYEQGGYVFIGGNFNAINGNAQPQYGIARVALSTYTEDVMFDSGNTEAGVAGGEVYDMTDVAGELDIVGSFLTTNTGNAALRMLSIGNPYVAGGGTQTFIESFGGADNTVYTILFEPTYARVYYGGTFSGVGINLFGGPTSAAFAAYWDIGAAIWVVVAGNTFNGAVNKIVFTGHTDLYAVGAFNMVPSYYNCYLDLSTTTASDSNIILSTPPTFQQAFGGAGGLLAVMDGTTFYREDTATVWTSLGVPSVGTTITGINYDTTSSGDWKVIYDNYAYIRSHSVQPHSCAFTGSFKYDNTSYGTYTINPRNVSQQFIGDTTCTFWSIIGAGVGTFS